MKNINIIAMAGMGKRFRKKDINILKPLYPIRKKPIFYYAVKSLPASYANLFVCKNSDLKKYKLSNVIQFYFKRSNIYRLKKKTQGQAITCQIASNNTSNNMIVTFGSCDYSYSFNKIKFKSLIKTNDLIVFVNKPGSHNLTYPNQYGWVKSDKKNKILKINCKKKVSTKPNNDYVIVGAFSFKNINIFKKSFNSMKRDKEMINNEYYMDTVAKHALKIGYKVSMIKVNNYKNYGTPDSIKRYEK